MTKLRDTLTVLSVAVVVAGVCGEFGMWWAMMAGGGFVFVAVEVSGLADKRKGKS